MIWYRKGDKMKNVLIFVSGVAIGSVVTWKLIEKKYKDLADEEINSVIETFKNRKETKVKVKKNKKAKENISEENPDVVNYHSIVKNEYIDNSKNIVNRYIIAPEDFGEKEEYGTKSLTYFSDGIIADEINEPVKNFDEIIGSSFLDHFGDFEDDSVYIRDDDNEIDYEILKSESSYSEIVGGNS